MRIAIVDDNDGDRRWLAQRVQELLDQRQLEGTVLSFADAGSFLTAARQEPFTLAFLDIYMDGLDGVSAAQELRSFDRDCLLVFSTTSPTTPWTATGCRRCSTCSSPGLRRTWTVSSTSWPACCPPRRSMWSFAPGGTPPGCA